MKTKHYVIFGGIGILVIGFLFLYWYITPVAISPSQERVESPIIEAGVINVKAERNNQFLSGDYVRDYYTFAYDCDWSGLDVKCDGEIQYIGPSDVEVNGAHLDLWCVDSRDCIIDSDQVDIKSSDRQIYTLSCSVGQTKDIEANLAIKDGFSIYSNPADC